MDDIIVTTWGIGESYRNRTVHNIRKAINTGYDNVLPYIILTDKPSHFDTIRKETNKIIDVIDINKLREEYSPWSIDYEFIPKDDENYGNEYRMKNNIEEKRFSYGLHRFSLIKIHELGYRKFLYCDNDTDIRYDKIINKETTEEDFWEQFNTPINSMKGCDYEQFNFNQVGWTQGTIILSKIVKYALYLKFKDRNYWNHTNFLSPFYEQTEGPFRLYHLKSPEMVMEYFYLWDEATKMVLTEHREFREQMAPGRYMYIDNLLVTVVNSLLNIKILNFDKFWHTVNIYLQDRHFFPQGREYEVNGKKLSLQPADTLDGFMEINKELIDYLKDKNIWEE